MTVAAAAARLRLRVLSTLALAPVALSNCTVPGAALLATRFLPPAAQFASPHLQLAPLQSRCYRMMAAASVPPVHLVLDWDGTLTRKDTLHLLGKICAEFHARSSPNKQEDAPAPSNTITSATWDDIVKAYIDDFDAHASSYQPEREKRTTIAEEKAWLASLVPVEQRSTQRVEAAGLFKGVTAADVQQGAAAAVDANELELRDGWDEVLLTSNTKTTVISVNWSATFIRAALLHAAAKHNPYDSTAEGSPELKEKVQALTVLANEIDDLNGSAGSSGLLNVIKDGGNIIRTSADKLAHMPTPRKFGGDALVVYAGDSATDLEALLAADVGICVRDVEDDDGGMDVPAEERIRSSSQKELAETLKRVGVQVQRIKLLAEMPPADDSTVRLYWAKNLREVAMSLSSYS